MDPQSDMALTDDEGLQEERRVLLRRAVNVCTKTDWILHRPIRYYPSRMGLDDGHGYGQLSRFVTDVVKEKRLEGLTELAPEGEELGLASRLTGLRRTNSGQPVELTVRYQ